MLKNPNPMEARTGRDKQMYKEGSIRQVAGCVPINRVTKEILLITRRKKEGGWVLPKGGWENDETEREAAARETYEEAGARGRVTSFIGVWDHDVNKSTGLPKAIFSFFEMEVDRLEERWPEMDERDRQWFSYEDALKALIKPFMREVIEHCSLAPLSPPPLPSNNNNNRRFSSRKLESQQQQFLKNKLIRPPSPSPSPSPPTTLSPKLVTINTTQLPTSPPPTSFLLSPTSLSSRNIKLLNSNEEHKDVLIWRFSVFIIILSIFFWYFTAKNNNNNNNSENFSSFFSIANEG